MFSRPHNVKPREPRTTLDTVLARTREALTLRAWNTHHTEARLPAIIAEAAPHIPPVLPQPLACPLCNTALAIVGADADCIECALNWPTDELHHSGDFNDPNRSRCRRHHQQPDSGAMYECVRPEDHDSSMCAGLKISGPDHAPAAATWTTRGDAA